MSDADVPNDQVEEESSTETEQTHPNTEAPTEEPQKQPKPLALPSTAYDQVPDPLDVEPDLLFPFFHFY